MNGGWRGALCCLGGHLSREDFHIDACVTPPPQALGLPDRRKGGKSRKRTKAQPVGPRTERHVMSRV